jgi:hypothetical protein
LKSILALESLCGKTRKNGGSCPIVVSPSLVCCLTSFGLISHGRYGGDFSASKLSAAMANELCADQANGDGKACTFSTCTAWLALSD